VKRFRVPEVVLGLLLGVVLSLFAAGVGSYQTSQCKQANYHNAQTPSLDQPQPASQQGDYGQHQVGEQARHSLYFGCGALGLVPTVVGFMDVHEGFFVGGFTLALFFATILLWLAGERQMELIAENSTKQSSDMQASIVENRRTADIAMEALGADRAWLILDGIQPGMVSTLIIDGIEHDRGVVIQMKWKNYGRTPALRTSLYSQQRLLAAPSDPPHFTFLENPNQKTTILGPDQAGRFHKNGHRRG
jgi:hypothetical protein